MVKCRDTIMSTVGGYDKDLVELVIEERRKKKEEEEKEDDGMVGKPIKKVERKKVNRDSKDPDNKLLGEVEVSM